LFGHGVLKNLIQALSTFKDLETQIQGVSRTMSVFKDFPGFENPKKIKDFQGPARALHTTHQNNVIVTRVRFCSPCSGPMTLAGRCRSRSRFLARQSSLMSPALRTIRITSGPRKTKKQ